MIKQLVLEKIEKWLEINKKSLGGAPKLLDICDESNAKFEIPYSNQKIYLSMGLPILSWEKMKDCEGEELTSSTIDNYLDNGLKYTAAKLFYSEKYDTIFSYSFAQQQQLTLQSKKNACRFCNTYKALAQFRKQAHAVPDSIGNKTLFSSYECDECNEFFGQTIESDFGNFTNPARTMNQIYGKRGVPSLHQRKGRISHHNERTEIIISDDSFATLEKNKVILHLERPSYKPISVLKAFTKMAASVMPDSIIKEFQTLPSWLLNKTEIYTNDKIVESFCQNSTFHQGRCILFKQKEYDIDEPYCTFIITFGLFCYQIILQRPGDQGPVEFLPFAFLMSKDFHITPTSYMRSYSDNIVKKRDAFEITLNITSFLTESE